MKIATKTSRYFMVAIATGLLTYMPTIFAQQTTQGFALAPGVIIDEDNDIAYTMSPKGVIDALELTKGEIIWTSGAAAKPVAIRGEQLIAQAEPEDKATKLVLMALNREDGKAINEASIDIGEIVTIDDTRDHQFHIGSEFTNTNKGLIVWRYHYYKLSGPEADLENQSELFGALEVRENAAIQTIENGGSPLASGKPPYALPRLSRPVSEQPEKDQTIIDVDSGLRFRIDGGKVENQTRALKADALQGGLFLSANAVDEEFTSVHRIPGQQFAESIDKQNIVASEFTGRLESAQPYRWTVYQRNPLSVVATFQSRTSLAPFYVSDQHVIYIRQPYQQREDGVLNTYPLALVAHDINSGAITWEHTLRNTMYRGPIPNAAQ